MEYTDEQLAQKIKDGDVASFDVLFKRYHEKIARYIQRLLFDSSKIDDIVQDVFLKVYEKIQSYDSKYPFSVWIYRIARNKAIDEIRRTERHNILIYDHISMDTILPFSHSSVEKEIDIEEERKVLDGHIQSLNVKYREVVVLYYFEGKDYEEISHILKIPKGTVGVRLRRARDIIKKLHE